MAESFTAVAFKTDTRCRVATGERLTPYSNTVVTDPSKLDVDHMVPLSNAYDSGAWNWSAERREHYANYLGDPQHLIAVTASANRSKGARGPQDWKPEDRTYWCRYATDWITIKDTWDLTVTQHEYDALVEMATTCDATPTVMTRQGQAGPAIITPERPIETPETVRYSCCGAAQAAGETRVQGNKGDGRGLPRWIVPSARDGDGDGVVCEKSQCYLYRSTMRSAAELCGTSRVHDAGKHHSSRWFWGHHASMV